MNETRIDKSLIGNYVCFTKPDGSFTWGRIINQGLVNTVKGDKRVLIMTDQMTCRVAQNRLELQSIMNLDRRIGNGTSGPTYIAGSGHKMLPEYQRDELKKIGEGESDKKDSSLMRVNPESNGLVPLIENEMKLKKSEGLPINQKVGKVKSRIDGHEINFALRQFGYNTIVFQDSLNLQTDIINPESEEFKDLTEEEMFYKAMSLRIKNGHPNEIFGGVSQCLLGN